jgi:hypothetical protein
MLSNSLRFITGDGLGPYAFYLGGDLINHQQGQATEGPCFRQGKNRVKALLIKTITF